MSYHIKEVSYVIEGRGLRAIAQVNPAVGQASVIFERAHFMPDCLKAVFQILANDARTPLHIELREPAYQHKLEQYKDQFELSGPVIRTKRGVEVVVFQKEIVPKPKLLSAGLLQMPQPLPPCPLKRPDKKSQSDR